MTVQAKWNGQLIAESDRTVLVEGNPTFHLQTWSLSSWSPAKRPRTAPGMATRATTASWWKANRTRTPRVLPGAV